MPMTFRFRWVAFIAALAVAAAGFALGQWQTRRALEKEAIEARLVARASMPPLALNSARPAPDEAEYRPVSVQGEFLRDWNVYLDNRPHKGVAGFYVLTPLKIAGSDMHVLVSRGWLPRDPADRSRLPDIPTPPGLVTVQGIGRRSAGRVMELGQAAPLQAGAIRQNAEIAEFEHAAGIRLLPFVIEQSASGAAGDGLVRDWPRPSSGSEKHRGYAFQWYALAALALVFFVVTGFRRGTK